MHGGVGGVGPRGPPLSRSTGGAQTGVSRARRNPWNGMSKPYHRPGRGGGTPTHGSHSRGFFAPSGARKRIATESHGFRSSRSAGTRFTRGYNPTPFRGLTRCLSWRCFRSGRCLVEARGRPAREKSRIVRAERTAPGYMATQPTVGSISRYRQNFHDCTPLAQTKEMWYNLDWTVHYRAPPPRYSIRGRGPPEAVTSGACKA